MLQQNVSHTRRGSCMRFFVFWFVIPLSTYVLYIVLVMHFSLPSFLYLAFSQPFDRTQWRAASSAQWGVFFINPRYHMLADLLANNRLRSMNVHEAVELLGPSNTDGASCGACFQGGISVGCYILGEVGFPSVARVTFPDNRYYEVLFVVYQPDPGRETTEYMLTYCPDTR